MRILAPSSLNWSLSKCQSRCAVPTRLAYPVKQSCRIYSDLRLITCSAKLSSRRKCGSAHCDRPQCPSCVRAAASGSASQPAPVRCAKVSVRCAYLKTPNLHSMCVVGQKQQPLVSSCKQQRFIALRCCGKRLASAVSAMVLVQPLLSPVRSHM